MPTSAATHTETATLAGEITRRPPQQPADAARPEHADARRRPTPPSTLSVTASTRNCTSTSRPRAPSAMRMPISRVRSVTDTSMMFMIPMPPTSSETLATLASSAVIVRLDRSSEVAISASVTSSRFTTLPATARASSGLTPFPLIASRACVLHGEVVRVGRAESMARRSSLVTSWRCASTRPPGPRTPRWTGDAPTSEQLLDCGVRGIHFVERRAACSDQARALRDHADHRELRLADADGVPSDRSLPPKSFSGHRRRQHDDRLAASVTSRTRKNRRSACESRASSASAGVRALEPNEYRRVPFHMTALSLIPGATAGTPAHGPAIAPPSSTDSRFDAPRPATRGDTAIPAHPPRRCAAAARCAVVDELMDAPPAKFAAYQQRPRSSGSRLPGE